MPITAIFTNRYLDALLDIVVREGAKPDATDEDRIDAAIVVALRAGKLDPRRISAILDEIRLDD